MRWQAGLVVVAVLAVLWGLVRALRGGPQPTKTDKDAADRWLHAESDAVPPEQDAPVNGSDPSADAGDSDGTEN